ncbi:MAG TPA: hypothetical protein VH639_17400 [Bryobacteraceae bacterium]|jgi:hypothetical protein
MRRLLYYALPPAVCLALFWRTLFTWFNTDDFGLLWLASTAHDPSSLAHALFHPIAQGTVRILSDRLFYLVIYSLFGIAAAPFHVAILLTWFATLGLASAVGTRITGSRAAGLVAALLWTTSKVMVSPLAWAAVYEVVLCSFFALAALYARIRWLDTRAPGWAATEWILYILGFGAQESMVMYPVAALLYTWAVAGRDIRKKGERGVFALFIPAAVFTAIHAFFIPKVPSEIYRIAVDARLPVTLSMYLRMAVGPEHYASRKILLPTLAIFAAWRMRRPASREFGAALFCVGWFLLWLVPVLPLPNHISEYYLTVPLAGLAWLAGWAAMAAWRSGWVARAGLGACLTLYLVNALPAIRNGTSWYKEGAARMRLAFRGMQEAAFEHPDTMVIFKGVDNDLFKMGFQDNPFRLAGVSQGFLAPGTENGISVARADLGGLSTLTISTEDALRAVESGRARVLELPTDAPARDVTGQFEIVARAEFLASRRNFVDAGRPEYSSRLGPSWHRIENDDRWMPKSATLQLAGPSSPAERLYVTGFGAAEALASGPVTLHFQVAGRDVGTATITQPGRPFQCDFGLPADLTGQYLVEVAIQTSRTFRAPGDGRELGMIFGTFAIR